ncbi:MAG: RibD family protein [Pseudonocardia sp.]
MIERRPHVLLSVAASLDGYIDDGSAERLLLSNMEDVDRVDEIRSGVDAILVGAGTIRADDPRLLLRSGARRAERVRQGRPESPVKVTISNGGELDPQARFFTAGTGDKLVYVSSSAYATLTRRLGAVATVFDAGQPLSLTTVLADLADRGIARLMVEGGSAMHTLFLTSDVVDELHVVVAPFFVGDPGASRLVNPGRFPQAPDRPMSLAEVRRIGDLALLVYRPLAADGE